MSPRKGALVPALIIVALLIPSAGDVGANHIGRCFGKRPDLDYSHGGGAVFLRGTPGPDVLIGSLFADHIEGRGGADRICAIGGGDEVLGGRGNDRLSGGRASDEISGGRGADLLNGGLATDAGDGGAGNDTCRRIEQPQSCESLS
jgi:Ca2+-binding RTX toxin-like protein